MIEQSVHPLSLDWEPLLRHWQGQVLREQDRDRLGVGKQLAALGRPLPQPALCLQPGSESDVQRAMEFLARHRQGFAVRSGGHCFADLSSHAGVLLDLSVLQHLEVQGDTLRAGPGVCASEASALLSAQGRWLPTGGCPSVALGGLSLVGGFGLLGRRYGPVCEQVLSLRFVTPDAQLHEIDASSQPELFWALRGAGAGQFGVLTELKLRTWPAQPLQVLYARWPLAGAADVIAAWQQLAPQADPRVNLELALTAGDDPEDEDGAPSLEMFGVLLAEEAQAQSLLLPWRHALGRQAEALRVWPLPPEDAARYLCGMLDRQGEPAWQPSRPYKEHGYQFTKSGFFEQDLPSAAIDELLRHFAADRRYAQHRELEFIPWGGAYAAPGSSAFNHRTARFMIRHTAVVGARSSAELREHARAWSRHSRGLLAAHGNGRVYQGYADPELADWAQAYYGSDLPRLQALKARLDPEQLMRHAQALTPTSQL